MHALTHLHLNLHYRHGMSWLPAEDIIAKFPSTNNITHLTLAMYNSQVPPGPTLGGGDVEYTALARLPHLQAVSVEIATDPHKSLDRELILKVKRNRDIETRGFRNIHMSRPVVDVTCAHRVF